MENKRTYTAEELAQGMDEIDSLPCLYPTCAECPYVGADGRCSGDLPVD